MFFLVKRNTLFFECPFALINDTPHCGELKIGILYIDHNLEGGCFMHIDCYLFEGCGAEQDLRKNIAQALVIEKVKAEVNLNIIDDKKAIALGLSGSPSVFVNGKEIQPQGTVGFS
jgi:hypothetical protein